MTVPKEVTDLIQSSGNNFQAKVARWFTEDDWYVVVSPYYLDQSQSKAREIDLLAEKIFPVKNRFGQKLDELAVRLFIECKYVPSYSVFWFADKDRQSAMELVCSNGYCRSNNTFTNDHHYLSECQKVAKVFSTSKDKALENELFYKAINQALHGMVSMGGQPISIPEVKNANRRPRTILEYPVVVCSSFEKMYCVDFFSSTDPEQIDSNFQLEIRYAYIDRQGNSRNDYFLLDFVAYDHLEKFSQLIQKDAETVSFFISST